MNKRTSEKAREAVGSTRMVRAQRYAVQSMRPDDGWPRSYHVMEIGTGNRMTDDTFRKRTAEKWCREWNAL